MHTVINHTGRFLAVLYSFEENGKLVQVGMPAKLWLLQIMGDVLNESVHMKGV
jgi:hypothetical protein